MDDKSIKRKTWKEFQDNGLLWWINRILHTFGWAIVILIDENNQIIDSFPARVKFRGFLGEDEEEGFIKISNYMLKNCDKLLKESKE